MNILIDMNLSPLWVPTLTQHGFNATHWSSVGDPRATDREIMDWARTHDYVVFTHDLDFGALLAASNAVKPSVVQFRAQNVLPQHLEQLVIAALRQYESVLTQGALIIVDAYSSRTRILPLSSQP
jgi:predicted nuclease of predicted toxin-antitoxin system